MLICVQKKTLANPRRRAPLLEPVQHLQQVRGQPLSGFRDDGRVDPFIKGLGDAPGHAGYGVAVPAQPDCLADGVLVVLGLQKGDDSLGHRALAGLVEFVGRPDVVEPPAQVIAELPLDVLPDPGLVLSGPGQEYGGGHCLGPLDALGVVVGDLGAPGGLGKHLVEFVVKEPHRAHPHGRAVAVRIVGPGVRVHGPGREEPAVAAVRVAPGVGLQDCGIVLFVEQAVGHGYGEDRVVGEAGVGGEKGEVRDFGVVDLVNRADDVPGDGADHSILTLFNVITPTLCFLLL